MKKFINNKSAVPVLLISVVLLLLSSCSGVLGGDYNVRISIPQLASADGRYIATDASSGYIVVLKGDKIYSLNKFSGQRSGFDIYLPLGTYIFGVVLLDSDDKNVGLAIKERAVKEGVNEFTFDVGPGIHEFLIGEESIEDMFTPDSYSTSFAENTIFISHPDLTGPNLGVNVTVGFTETSQPLSNVTSPIDKILVNFDIEEVAYIISVLQDEKGTWKYTAVPTEYIPE